MKCRAAEVIPHKIWITYDETGSRTGTLKTSDGQLFIQYFMDGSKIERSMEEATTLFSFQSKTENTSQPTEILGYPILQMDRIFNVKNRDELPCFTKTPTSKIFYAAGFYSVKFYDGAWQEVFCPKLTTLRKHEFLGPCKTKDDLSILVKRTGRKFPQ